MSSPRWVERGCRRLTKARGSNRGGDKTGGAYGLSHLVGVREIHEAGGTVLDVVRGERRQPPDPRPGPLPHVSRPPEPSCWLGAGLDQDGRRVIVPSGGLRGIEQRTATLCEARSGAQNPGDGLLGYMG